MTPKQIREQANGPWSTARLTIVETAFTLERPWQIRRRHDHKAKRGFTYVFGKRGPTWRFEP